jgi:hypothetical protein
LLVSAAHLDASLELVERPLLLVNLVVAIGSVLLELVKRSCDLVQLALLQRVLEAAAVTVEPLELLELVLLRLELLQARLDVG